MSSGSGNKLLDAAKSSLLGDGSGTSSIQDFLEHSAPGFGFLQNFFSTWLKIDLTTLAAALTIMGTISGGLQNLQGLALKVYWWFTKFLTASISIASSDRLNREILNWLGAHILTRQGTRVLTARTETVQTDAWYPRRTKTERNDYHHEKRVPIEYLPTFGTTWFIHEYRVFLIRRIPTTHYGNVVGVPDEYAAAPEGDEPLVIMVLGRSVVPIKRFLDTCRDFAEKQREAFVTVRANKSEYHDHAWDTTILRPIRPLETVHFDEAMKAKLVADIRNYLDPATRRFYNARGIPYRRGYLLHGPPGTGKTSLSLALAGVFNLELYLVHIPSIREDTDLERLFTLLPPQCIVLLEDIDAVGVKRQLANGSEDEEDSDDNKMDKYIRSRVTLSGLLNVLDGISSQEGRIVFMTSNMAHKLDSALVRPGRIDMMIYLGSISQRSAELMFLRMYAPNKSEGAPTTPDLSQDISAEKLQALASDFSSKIPADTFTPAELQGYLLSQRGIPARAVEEISTWVGEEMAKKEESKKRAKEAEKRRAKKKAEAKVKVVSTSSSDDDSETESDRSRTTSRKKRKARRKLKKAAQHDGEPVLPEEQEGDDQQTRDVDREKVKGINDGQETKTDKDTAQELNKT
ncbi:mitochondrial chaperone bcs1 [Phlyctema vagabunda]|uniref:Mitochondrial chaperone bcs1 n=1 Tax=Phlyctema vagabunda TaxID=108571 RepID=A0ABR4PUK8_9HELO